jgi:hypothetical protein
MDSFNNKKTDSKQFISIQSEQKFLRVALASFVYQ